MDERPRLASTAFRIAVLLAGLAIVAAILAVLPHTFPFGNDTSAALLSAVLPWLVVLTAWEVLVRQASRSVDAMSDLPSQVFRAATWGAVALVVSQVVLVAFTADGSHAFTVVVMTTVEDLLYGFGILALGALAAFAFTRTLSRVALREHVVGTAIREVSLRTRFVVIATGVSFATAGILLDVLVDFESTSDATILGYLGIAAGLVVFATIVAWLIGDDIAVREQAAAAAAAERDRIARELHDGVAKSVSILALEAATAANRLPPEMRPELLRIERLARLLSEEMRAILTNIRAQGDGQRFDEALRAVVERHAPAELETAGDIDRIGTLARFEVLRIVGEGLANARRHAGAQRLCARVAATGDRVTVEVEDDGRGIGEIDWNALPRSGRYGLIGIRERAELLRGEARLERGRLGGTMVHVDFPLAQAQP